MTTTASKSWEVFAKGLTDIRTLATCKICTRLMFEPYTVKCGHTFCYGCLSQWLRRGQGRRCPDCRTKVRDEPCPDFTIRNIVHVLISNSSFLDDGDTVESLEKEKEEQAKVLETDKSNTEAKGLFGGLFSGNKQYGAILDEADGVLRCPDCNWELDGMYCEQCDINIDEQSIADFSDDYGSELDYDSQDDFSDEPNEEDQAFIDDDGNVLFQHGGWQPREPPRNPRSGLPDYGYADIMLQELHRRTRESTATSSTPITRSGSDISIDEDLEGSGEESSSASSDTDESDRDDEAHSLTNNPSESDASGDEVSQSSNEPRQQRRRPQRVAVSTASTSNRNRNGSFRQFPSASARFEVEGAVGNQAIRQDGSNVIDLTIEDRLSPAGGRRRARQALQATTDRAGPSNTARASAVRNTRNAPGQPSREDSESEEEAPIAIRSRKRERIVLEDSDEDEEVAGQVETRSRRRQRTAI